MASRLFGVILICFEVAQSQFYSLPAPNYNYVPTPTFVPTFANPPRPSSPPTPPKRSVSPPLACPKCSPATASAYFLTPPSEQVKATVLTKDKLKNPAIVPPVYNCPLCNGFADVPLSSKIPPPPPIGSPVLPGILDEVPTKNLELLVKDLVKELSNIEPISIVPPKSSRFSDMYEKHKQPKQSSFDQELLEGFLTGLGMVS